MPVILAIQEAEIRRIVARSQPRQIARKTLSQKYPSQKRAGGVAHGEGPEFKTQYCKKNKKKNSCAAEQGSGSRKASQQDGKHQFPVSFLAIAISM
jgi:hypothetical protein